MPMKIDSKDFRVAEGHSVKLERWPTLVKPFYKSKKDYQDLLHEHVARLSSLQQLLYAADSNAILLIFQAMDAAGKDGAIRHVMSGVNPQGCQVFSYKHPSATELQHDFLWRTTRDLPERGRIGIFNRSYYEDVLIVRVHPELLLAEGVPGSAEGKKALWQHRYRSINNLERHLCENGTRVVKFFLHLSKEEQRKRFLARIDEPDKNWKFSQADIEERRYWKDYMKAYEACLEATSTDHAPWYVVPADDKENARLIVSQVVVDTLERLDMHYPQTSAERRRELLAIRKQLEKSRGAYSRRARPAVRGCAVRSVRFPAPAAPAPCRRRFRRRADCARPGCAERPARRRTTEGPRRWPRAPAHRARRCRR
jgi:PPK2 family polyphosphate:nucleotide phosphotransferase